MMERIIQKHVHGDTNYIVGFANLTGIILHNKNQYGVVIGRKLDDKIIDPVIHGPTLEYYHYYNAINAELGGLIHQIADDIRCEGYNCDVVEPTIMESDVKDPNYEKTLRTPVSHKMIGTRSGLGWIGKTDLFVSSQFGPRLRLVSLLTNYPLESKNKPIDKSKCGTCNICVQKCPAQAATGQLWDIYTDRDTFFDAHKCRNKCGELAKTNLNVNIRVCGICVAACPIGQKRN